MPSTDMSTPDEKNASQSPLSSVRGEMKPDSDNSLVESEEQEPQEGYSFIGMLFILLALILCVFLVNIAKPSLMIDKSDCSGLPRPDNRGNCHPENHGRVQGPGPRGLVRQRLLHHHRKFPVDLW